MTLNNLQPIKPTLTIAQDGTGDYNCGSSQTDCQTVISQALTAAEALGGGTVLLKEGTYLCDGVILWSYENVTLKGQGESSIIKTNGANSFNLSTAGKILRIKDLFIWNTSNGNEIGQGIYQTADVTAHYFLERVKFTTTLNAFYIDNDVDTGSELGNLHVVDCRFINCSSNTDGTEYVDGQYHVVKIDGFQTEDYETTFSRNYFVHTSTRENAAGISYGGDSSSGNGQGATACQGGIFSDNQFIDCKREGLYISDTRHMLITNNRMYGTGVNGEARIGFSFLRGYRNAISNNYCEKFSNRAYRIDHNTECVWIGNAAFDVGEYNGHTPTAAGMTIKGSQNNIIMGNLINTSTGASGDNSVVIMEGDHDGSTMINSSGNFIAHNKLTGGTTAIYFDDDNQYDNTIIQPENFKVWFPDTTTLRVNNLQRKVSSGLPLNHLKLWFPNAESSGDFNDFSKTGARGTVNGTLTRSQGRYNYKVSNAGDSANTLSIDTTVIGTLAATFHFLTNVTSVTDGVQNGITDCSYDSGRWYQVGINGSDRRVRIRFHDGTAYRDLYISGYTVPLSEEVALTIVLDDDGAGGVDAVLYENGIEVATANIASYQPSLTSGINKIYGAGSNVPNATFENFMVFDTTLTATQVLELVSRPLDIKDIQAYQHKVLTPTISTGTAAPSSTPSKVGDIFIDTTNANIYISKGTSNSADWTQVNN